MKLFVTAVLSSLSLTVAAQGYVLSSDSQPVRDSSGQCVRTGSWTPSDRNPACDPAPVVATTSVSLGADVMFGFDKSELTDRGRSALYKIANAIPQGSRVTVTGFADWIGNAVYNQALSERRARSVAEFLQTQVQAVYTVVGRGSSEPLPSTLACKGETNFNRLVACLAPNRRVEIKYTNK